MVGTILTVAILVSALMALVSALVALRAYLRLRRTRKERGGALFAEVERLSRRATEVEANLRALDARAQALPIHVGGIQRNLDTLGVLAVALAVSLRQARKALSPTGLAPLSRALKSLRPSAARAVKHPDEPGNGS